MKRVSERLAAIAPSATLAVDAKAKALKAQGENVIGFGAGEPDFPTPAHIVAAAEAACRDPRFHHYSPTPGLPELREAIAHKTKRDSGVDCAASQVVVTNGGKHAVYNTFQVLCNEGDEILVPAPYWTSYPEEIALGGGVPVALPTTEAARLALRTQQVIAFETGVTRVADPLGGSWAVESLTAEIVGRASALIAKVDEMGGALAAIEAGYFQREIAESAFRYQREIDEQKRIIVGVNEYTVDAPLTIPILEMDPEGEQRQLARLQDLRLTRDNEQAGAALTALRAAAQGTQNMMPFILDAVKAYATLQEITDVLRRVFGVYQEPVIV